MVAYESGLAGEERLAWQKLRRRFSSIATWKDISAGFTPKEVGLLNK